MRRLADFIVGALCLALWVMLLPFAILLSILVAREGASGTRRSSRSPRRAWRPFIQENITVDYSALSKEEIVRAFDQL